MLSGEVIIDFDELASQNNGISNSFPRVANAATWVRARARGAGFVRTIQLTATCLI